jgi:hypothetical protein
MMMMMNNQRKRKVTLTVPTPLCPAHTRRRSVAATERQTFQLLQCAWDLLAVWKKETDKTLTHMQTFVFVGRRFWYLMILTGR